MSHAKQASKRRRRNKAVPVLGAASLSLSLVSGASAAASGPAADMPVRNPAVTHEIALAEEEISGVSLATFYVFDKDNEATSWPRLRVAMGCSCGGGCGCGGCGCWTGTYYTPLDVGGYPPPPPRHHAVRPAHRHKHARAHVPKKS
jgi:hypothetical protein